MRRGCHRRDECAPASRCSGASGLATRRLLRPSSDLPSGARTARVRSASFVRGLCFFFRFMYRGREHVPLTCSFFDILICHLARAHTNGRWARTIHQRAPLEQKCARKCAGSRSHVTALFDTLVFTLVYAYGVRGHARGRDTTSARRPPARVGRTTARHCGYLLIIYRREINMKHPTDMLHSRHTLCDVVWALGSACL